MTDFPRTCKVFREPFLEMHWVTPPARISACQDLADPEATLPAMGKL